MAVTSQPLISIGMTIYNQKPFLREAIEAVIAQEYRNFELIISDNASEDGSQEICLEYARKDERVTCIFNKVNGGPDRNLYKVLDASSGAYLALASGHDLHHPDFLSKLVETFNRADESVVLCYPRTSLIDLKGNLIQHIPETFDTCGKSPAERFHETMWGLSWCTPLYGLFRLSAFRKTWKARQVTGPDRIFLADLSLAGPFAYLDETLFFLRRNRPDENITSNIRRQIGWFVTDRYEALVPATMKAYEHMKIIRDSGLSAAEKDFLMEDIVKWINHGCVDLLHREILCLVKEGIGTLRDPKLSHQEKIVIAYEFVRLADLCKFFSPRHAAVLDRLLLFCSGIRHGAGRNRPLAGAVDESGLNSASRKIETLDGSFPENKDKKILQFIDGLRTTPPSRKLRLMQVDTFYPKALEIIYRKTPALSFQSYEMQMEAIRKEGFAAVHTLAPYLSATGYDTFWAIANNPFTQMKWMKEQGIPSVNEREWIYDIAARQIEAFKPDILYTTDACLFDSRFIRRLTSRPPVVAGWHAADIPAHTDWSEFDLILSALGGVRAEAERIGAKAAVCFTPGFPEWIQQEIIDVHPTKDVVFCGQWTVNQHSRRNSLIERISREASERARFSLSLFLSGRTDLLPEVVRKNQAGERYGMEMYRALRTGRIGLDGRGSIRKEGSGPGSKELAGNQTANMRIFETTGSGVFLLTEYFENLSDFFEIGREIETFKTEEELVEKIEYYMRHPEEREEIALRGQRRCLTDHSMTSRIRLFDSIVRNALAGRKASSCKKESVSNNWLGDGRCEGGVVIPAR